METADPRAELIRKWSIESPGLLEEAGFAGVDPAKTLGIFGKFSDYEHSHKAAKKNHIHQTAKKHKNGSALSSLEQNTLLKLLLEKQGHSHTKKKGNRYVHGNWTQESLVTEMTKAHTAYEKHVSEIRNATISLPENIQSMALPVWRSILAFKGSSSTADSIFTQLETLGSSLSSLIKTLKGKDIKSNVKRPKDISKIDKYNGEGLLISRFLLLIAKYIQATSAKSERTVAGYYDVKKLARNLNKSRKFVRDVKQGLDHLNRKHTP